MQKRTRELLKWGAIGAAGVLGGSYLLYRLNPSLADKVGASWILQKFRLAPVVYPANDWVPVEPVDYSALPAPATPSSPPQTLLGEEIRAYV